MASYFISHPEVVIDPSRPIETWRLSQSGVLRAGLIASTCWNDKVVQIASSTETKAVQTARTVAGAVGMPFIRVAELGENDRSATGFLPSDEFEMVADEFFAEPDRRVRGWESARAAQRRIVTAVRTLTTDPLRHTAIIAHGGVGTLLYCDLSGQPISRRFDQPGQGSWFEFDPTTWSARHGWRRIV
ncbi:histidine phosphatase family protein [Microbacteriaceae bacterium VKM Ac-2854]|nr:histidine phosphatase family protein [Microbacteriaceae bacterium VKM Ac-2854]